MRKVLKSRQTKSGWAEVVESSSFLGGISYQLVVAGVIKESSADRSYIEREFDRLW